jgi:hypothetical protein
MPFIRDFLSARQVDHTRYPGRIPPLEPALVPAQVEGLTRTAIALC